MPTERAALIDVRVGGHLTFDRVTLEFDGACGHPHVNYVEQVAPARGRALLRVTTRPVATSLGITAHGLRSRLPVVTDTAALREITCSEDALGTVVVRIGVAARTPFAVRSLGSPNRIAVDVTHTVPGTGRQVLRLGDNGPAVATWQWRLRLALDRDLAVDEVFGPATRTATAEFQGAHGIAADGIAGPRTRRAMEQALHITPVGRIP